MSEQKPDYEWLENWLRAEAAAPVGCRARMSGPVEIDRGMLIVAADTIGRLRQISRLDATSDEVREQKPEDELMEAVESLLEAASRTTFYDCGTIAKDERFGDGDDDMSVDGGSCPLTEGHFRRLKRALTECKR